jgi:Tfp pilus assembly protein PilX
MQLRSLTAKLRARAGEEHGMTMLLALFVLVITTLILGGTFMAVLNDTGLSRNSLDQKRAYAAAQAGIQAYNYQLNQNESYWQTCTPLGNTGATGFNGTNGNGFVTVPGSTDAGGGSESYFVKPLAATTAPSTDDKCDAANPLATMIEGSASGIASGSFRISSIGRSGNVSRTIIAQYKPPSFLDYVYYTDYETLDPAAIAGDPSDCERHYKDNPGRGSDCGGPINFITGDSINGPLHSEDWLSICGSPVFGRTSADRIEAPGYTNESGSGCANTPDMVGTYNSSAPSITPPPDNSQLLQVTQSAYHFTGRTTIVLNDSTEPNTLTVTNAADNYVNQSLPWPSNGVVYVSTASSGCPITYTPYDSDYTDDTNCGNVYVSGSYSDSLTIASDNDVIIDGSITTPVDSNGVPTTNALLGLIANDFVRIYHPLINGSADTANGCSVTTGSGQHQTTTTATNDTANDLNNPVIYAAILAVNHSFIVDNYNCGDTLNTLKVYGAIAQLFRGPVGTGGSSGATSGYAKSYNYDDRLANEEPPYFLDPVSAQWYVSRETECDGSSC